MAALVFVYGTLKQGFPNHGINTGRRVEGQFRTRQRLPLVVVRLPHEDRAPWLIDSPGQGHHVIGQVYEVDDAALQAMDLLEEVGQPTGYRRLSIELEQLAPPHATLHAQAYLKAEDQLAHCLACEGPYPEYTAEMAVGYWLITP